MGARPALRSHGGSCARALCAVLVPGLFWLACGAPPVTGPSAALSKLAPATEVQTRLPTPADLTGVWAPVAADAGPGPFRVMEPCYAVPSFWAIEQRGTSIAMLHDVPQPVSGMMRTVRYSTRLFLEGTRNGGSWALTGESVTEKQDSASAAGSQIVSRSALVADLDYEDKTGHLVGTVGGGPVRLAPLILLPREKPCGPPPP